MQRNQCIVSLLVSNHAGVLTRISSLFARRSFNIESLTVGVTQDPSLSRMTIVSWGDEYLRAQIVKQLHKLVDVKKVQLMDQDKIVVRELMMVKIKLEEGGLPEVMQAINAYRANVVDLSPSSIAVEIMGEPTKLNAFLHFLSKYEIVEMCRTGPTAMGRGSYCLENES